MARRRGEAVETLGGVVVTVGHMLQPRIGGITRRDRAQHRCHLRMKISSARKGGLDGENWCRVRGGRRLIRSRRCSSLRKVGCRLEVIRGTLLSVRVDVL
eukprot:1518222-Rhodomonas_salina.1